MNDGEKEYSTGNHEENDSSMNDNDVIVTEVRKLFKLGKAQNVLCGAQVDFPLLMDR